MKRRHTLVISLLFGTALAAGALATARTLGLEEPSSASASDQVVAAEAARLDRLESSLRRRQAEAGAAPAPAASAPGEIMVRSASEHEDDEGDEGEEAGEKAGDERWDDDGDERVEGWEHDD